MVILAMALFVRAVIPAGYMVAPSSLKLTVQVCADGGTGQTSVEIEVPLSKGGQRDKNNHGQTSGPRAFSPLSGNAFQSAATTFFNSCRTSCAAAFNWGLSIADIEATGSIAAISTLPSPAS